MLGYIVDNKKLQTNSFTRFLVPVSRAELFLEPGVGIDRGLILIADLFDLGQDQGTIEASFVFFVSSRGLLGRLDNGLDHAFDQSCPRLNKNKERKVILKKQRNKRASHFLC